MTLVSNWETMRVRSSTKCRCLQGRRPACVRTYCTSTTHEAALAVSWTTPRSNSSKRRAWERRPKCLSPCLRANTPTSSRALPGLPLPQQVIAQLLRLDTHGGESGEFFREQLIRVRALMILKGFPVGDDHVMIFCSLG